MSAKQRILIVDDDAFVRRPLEFILRQEGFESITAANADECLDRLAEQPADLIILDVMMPGRDGFELCKTIKEETRYADVPIVLLSARGQEHDRDRGLCLGAAEFMTKPYSPSDLLSRVRRLLSNEWGEE